MITKLVAKSGQRLPNSGRGEVSRQLLEISKCSVIVAMLF
jgi:hypothetical protein